MELSEAYLKVNKWIEKLEKFLAVIIISLIVIIVFSGTVARYVFNSPFYGSDRLATYLMIWLGFLGFQIAVSKLRHIEIEAIKSKVMPKIRYVMNMITCIIAAGFLCYMCSLAIEYLQATKELGDTDIVLEIELWKIIIIIPISFGISAIRYLFSTLLWLDVLKGRRNEEDIVKKELL